MTVGRAIAGRNPDSTEALIRSGEGMFVTLAYFAGAYHRPFRTVQSWVNRGSARSVTHRGALYVHYGDALRLHRDPRRCLRDQAS